VSLKGGVQCAGKGCWDSPRLDSGFFVVVVVVVVVVEKVGLLFLGLG
jgi:hypothetical protein